VVSGKNWVYPTIERSAFTKLLTVYSAAAAIALVGWVLNVGQLYWMAGALALLAQASRLIASWEQRDLSFSRDLPLAGHQGDEVTARLHARSKSFLPKLHLSVRDQLPKGLSAKSAVALPLHLVPFGQDTVEYRVRLGRRGWHELSAIQVVGTDPLGLAHQERAVTLPARILVYPRVIPLPPQTLPPEMGGGTAPIDSAFRQGEGTSFFGIREYRPGDPLRHVHWRTAARLGRLTVVEWEAEQSRDTLLAVETAAYGEQDLGPGTTLDLAAGLAASVASALRADDHSVALLVPGATERRGGRLRTSTPFPEMLETLARISATETSSLSVEFRRLAPELAPGLTICWITGAPGPQLVEDCRFMLGSRFRPVIYALIDTPRTSPPLSAWSATLAQLTAMGVPVTPLYRDDGLTQQLLS
jgi:uncharacterized protein (DUF58 family)